MIGERFRRATRQSPCVFNVLPTTLLKATFIILPLVPAFFIDIANALLIGLFVR